MSEPLDNSHGNPSSKESDGPDNNVPRRTGIDPSGNNRKYSAYTFNGRVVIGIGIILAVACGASLFATASSSSSIIRSNLGSLSSIQASAQQPENQKHIDKSFVLIANDFGFNGTTGGPTMQLSKGDVVQITYVNAGHMAHNFGIAKLSPSTEAILNKTFSMPIDQRVSSIPYDVMAVMPCPGCETKFDEGHIETFVQPDNQVITTFTASEAGHFKYFCEVRGHLWMGMMGDLIVLDKPSGQAPSTHTAQGSGQSNG